MLCFRGSETAPQRRYQKATMDRTGDWAAGRNSVETLQKHLMQTKSSGREYFNHGWLFYLTDTFVISLQNIQATLCDLTDEQVRSKLPDVAVESTAAHGLAPGGPNEPGIENPAISLR